MRSKFIRAPRTLFYLKLLGGGVLAILLVAYVGFQARGLLSGPVLTISSPKDGGTVVDPLVTIAGVATAITQISVNDRPIHTTTEGAFEEELLLAPGYNVISVEARDRFGRETRETLEVIHRTSAPEEVEPIAN